MDDGDARHTELAYPGPPGVGSSVERTWIVDGRDPPETGPRDDVGVTGYDDCRDFAGGVHHTFGHLACERCARRRIQACRETRLAHAERTQWDDDSGVECGEGPGRHGVRMLPIVEPVYVVAKGAFYPWLRHGLRWTIEGGHAIPTSGPVLLAGNHVSYLDPLTLAWVADRRSRRVRFLAKAELFEKPGLGFLLHRIHQIPVNRGSRSASSSLDSALDALRRGECVTVFPEGTISPDLDPMAGRSGAARIAKASGVPVTPVGLWGTHRIMFKGRKPDWRWGVAQTAVVGPPVSVGPDDNVREATDRIMEAICHCVARAREIYPETPRPGDEWWWRDPATAVLRSCRGAARTEGDDGVVE